MDFLSDEWLAALDTAARNRAAPEDDPLVSVSMTIDHVIVDGPHWRLTIDDGALSVTPAPEGEPDVRLTSDRETAAAIASGRRAALDAFISGDLRLGGDVRRLIDERAALEAMGDVFATVRADTDYAPRSAR
ncbi:MAG: SCP2 sterol-binding domain-containing protein [Acidimicrobiales bacterium]|nr:SCP2 sterol-binding domain-containing protein [Acidimicrobiales bacterium]